MAARSSTDVAEVRWPDPAAGERLRERIWLIARFGRLVRIDRPLADLAAQIARERELSGHDAAYVAAADTLGVTVASRDERDLVRPRLAKLPHDCLPGD
jgi:predicted nucleic acid-binding protein